MTASSWHNIPQSRVGDGIPFSIDLNIVLIDFGHNDIFRLDFLDFVLCAERPGGDLLTRLYIKGNKKFCFDDRYPKASADVLLEGTRERANRRGSLRMAPDVISFVITIPVSRPVSRNDQIRNI